MHIALLEILQDFIIAKLTDRKLVLPQLSSFSLLSTFLLQRLNFFIIYRGIQREEMDSQGFQSLQVVPLTWNSKVCWALLQQKSTQTCLRAIQAARRMFKGRNKRKASIVVPRRALNWKSSLLWHEQGRSTSELLPDLHRQLWSAQEHGAGGHE